MKVPNSVKNFSKCICIKCPTHNVCMKIKLQKLFCAKGKTKCKIIKKNCICQECPITFKYNLKRVYYCEKDMEI